MWDLSKLDHIDSAKDQQTIVRYCPLLLLHRLEFVKELVEDSQNVRRHIGLPLAVWKHYTGRSRWPIFSKICGIERQAQAASALS
jgi:hypothetical protein